MESMIKKHLISGIIVKAVAITASIYGIMRTTSGIMTFTYFTNLSNIAVDIILSVFLVLDIRALTGRTEIKAKPNILNLCLQFLLLLLFLCICFFWRLPMKREYCIPILIIMQEAFVYILLLLFWRLWISFCLIICIGPLRCMLYMLQYRLLFM